MDFVEMHRKRLREFIDWKRGLLEKVKEKGDKKHAEVIKKQLEVLENFLNELEVLKISKDKFTQELKKLQEIEEKIDALKGLKRGHVVASELKRLEGERNKLKRKVEERIGETLESIEEKLRRDFGENTDCALLLLESIKIGENPLSAPNRLPLYKRVDLIRKLYEKGYISAGKNGRIKLTKAGENALIIGRVKALKR